MKRICIGHGWRLVLFIGLTYCAMLAGPTAPHSLAQPPEDVSSACAENVRAFDFPGNAVVVLRGEKIVAQGAAGVRRRGHAEPILVTDKFHIGSCTKSMTGMLAGILVDRGQIRWDSTVGEVLGPALPDLHADYQPITLRQLLGHRAGVPADPTPEQWNAAWKLQGPTRDQHFAYAKSHLIAPLAHPADTQFAYSNAGYAIAGVMLEQAADQAWESLIQKEIFTPLEMDSAGIGPLVTQADDVSQPWGHDPEPVTPGPTADNPPAISAAGRVHCSLPDLARYVAAVNQGMRGRDRLVTAATQRFLATPLQGQDYALGWGVHARSWAKGNALSHAGSNTMYYCVIWTAPEIDFAVLAACNTGQPNAGQGLDALVAEMVRRFAAEP